jgi:hypothetical protein
MKKLLMGLVFSLLTLVPCYAQQGVRSHRFTIAGPDSSINLINTAIAFHKLTWNVSGTASVCTVALDTSSNGTTWSAGGAIAGQTCTSNGTSSTANVSANYVRINMTALTVTAGSSVTVTWDGYTSNPSGGGGVVCAISGAVAYETAANVLGCSSLFKWSDGVEALGLFTGPPTVSLSANLTPYFFGDVQPTIENSLTAVGSGATQVVGHGERVQSDKDLLGFWGHYIALDATNNIGGVVAGQQVDVYYNVPVGQTNINFQTAYEDNVTAYGAGTSAAAVGIESGANNNGTGVVTTIASFLGAGLGNFGGGTVHNAFHYWSEDTGAIGDTLNAQFRAEAETVGANNYGFHSDVTNKDHFGLLSAVTISTETNCKAVGSAASPSVAACGDAAAGMFSCATASSTTTCQVNTTKVTANSEIFITQDASDGGASQLNVTCNTALAVSTTKPILLSKNAGVSFTLNMGTIAVNPACFEYHIVN